MAEILADAPGRVNLIGEHTDYHDGFVMPCAVPHRTYVSLTRRRDAHVRLTSEQMPGLFEYDVGRELRTGGWGDFVQGLTRVLADAGHKIPGFDLHVRSDVPVGSGLSSSAALEISTLRALRSAFDLPLSDVDLAHVGQQAEVEFVGAPVGIMDQMASSLATERAALFLDTRSLEFEQVPLPAGLDLVIIDSGVPHRHATGDYVARRRESEAAARLLGVDRLRDAPDAPDRMATLPCLLARRARHVITENARVLEARQALLTGDLTGLGALFNASHVSLRDDYEVSIDAVDLLVELTQNAPHVYGARMTGGGFGGAIVAAVEAGHGGEVGQAVRRAYRERTIREPRVLVPLSPSENL
jgi:galactokinase